MIPVRLWRDDASQRVLGRAFRSTALTVMEARPASVPRRNGRGGVTTGVRLESLLLRGLSILSIAGVRRPRLRGSVVDARAVDTRALDTSVVDTRAVDTSVVDTRVADASLVDVSERSSVGFDASRRSCLSPAMRGRRRSLRGSSDRAVGRQADRMSVYGPALADGSVLVRVKGDAVDRRISDRRGAARGRAIGYRSSIVAAFLMGGHRRAGISGDSSYFGRS